MKATEKTDIAVLEVLKKHGAFFSVVEINNRVKLTKCRVRNSLERLVLSGKVERAFGSLCSFKATDVA